MTAICFLVAGCSREQAQDVCWEQLIRDLYAPGSINELSLPCTEILSSYDRTGRNQDYNTGFRDLGNGWLELADLRGPGVMTRFWFTGLDRKARIRFLFDNEREARLDATCDDFYQGRAGFPDAFVTTDQLCYYNGFPVPYNRRLRIWVEDMGYSRGQGKLFFQINAHPLKGQRVRSAQFPVPEEIARVAREVAASKQPSAIRERLSGIAMDKPFSLGPESGEMVVYIDEPGRIERMRIEIDGWQELPFERRMDILQTLWIGIRWDGAEADSIRVPVGEWSGQMWFPAKVETLYVSADDTGFENHLPMPFRRQAAVRLENLSGEPVSGRLMLAVSDGMPTENEGYLHAGRHRSHEKGAPHTVLQTEGRGRLAGIFLGVASYDRSFWVLESNETMTRDGGTEPFWTGTGLEDYFNGGWYYRTLYHEPLYGLTLKRPFRTVQYRFHLHDPVTFDREFKMDFERGPEQVSNALYDSIVFYYLEGPGAAFGDDLSREGAAAPPDEFLPYAVMTQLWDYEKMDDFSNAEKMNVWALTQWNYPDEMRQMLELRGLAYRVLREGIAGVRDRLVAEAAGTNAVAVAAQNLLALHEEGKGLVFASSNRRSAVFLNGVQILSTGDPTRTEVRRVDVRQGRNVIAVMTEAGLWPDWVQAGIRVGDRLVGTDRSWRCALDPSGDWRQVDYDDSGWTHPFGYAKGPPEMEVVPFVMPDPYVDLQAWIQGVRGWYLPDSGPVRVVYRKVFEVE